MNKTNPGVALVTGASTGIGHATAEALQNAGFRVFGTSRRAVAQRTDGVTMLTCDVTDDASVAKLVGDVLARAMSWLRALKGLEGQNGQLARMSTIRHPSGLGNVR